MFAFDNSGARRGQVIFVYKNNIKNFKLGTKVLLTLKRVVPNNLKKLKKGDKMKAVVVTATSVVKTSKYRL